MRELIFLITMLPVFWGLPACSGNSASSPAEIATGKSSYDKSAGPGIAEAIKKKTLDSYPAVTIGTAFDGYTYFTKKEWKETYAQHGKIYVDFIGSLAADSLTAGSIRGGVSAQAVDIKFVINPDGSFFVGMISIIESSKDGKVYSSPVVNTAPILEQIYAKNKIAF